MNSYSNKSDKQFVIEKYLDQVKILTALATTLLISPNLILSLSGNTYSIINEIKLCLISANIAFIITILLTYFIYSSIVGYIHKGEYNIYRPATIVFSIAQFIALSWGSISLIILFYFLFD